MRVKLRRNRGRYVYLRNIDCFFLKILVICTDIRGIISTLARICLFLFLFIKLFRLEKFLMWIVRVIFFIIHSVINIYTFMIEQFSIRYHGSVFEIFAETTCNEMDMYPSDVFFCEDLWFEVLRISLYNTYQLLLLVIHFLFLFSYTVDDPFVFEVFQLGWRPQSYIIDLFGQIF